MDQATRTRLEQFAGDCRASLGEHLAAVLVYGEPTWNNAAPATTALLVDAATLALIRKVTELAARWRRSQPAPLVLDREYLCTSCDVFPLELLTLRETHEVIWGDAAGLHDLEIAREHLRLEVEEQLKGKILHLRQAYIDARGRGKMLLDLLLDSSAGFEMVMRGLLYLDGRPHPGAPLTVLRAVEEATGTALPTFEQIQQGRLHGGLRSAQAEALFERYHDELTSLARVADRITRAGRTG